jgi:hypothetical protein
LNYFLTIIYKNNELQKDLCLKKQREHSSHGQCIAVKSQEATLKGSTSFD